MCVPKPKYPDDVTDTVCSFFSDQIINIVKAKLEDISEPWENVDLFKILSAERERLGLSVKVFMKALRYALTGMKVGYFVLVFCSVFIYNKYTFSIRMDLVWQLS